MVRMLADRPFRYHVHDRPIENHQPFASFVQPMIGIDGTTWEDRQVYSLKRDLEEVCRQALERGLDAGGEPIGKSAWGKDLLTLRLGSGAHHEVLIVGGTHAREWISVEVAYYLAEYLVANYSSSPSTLQEHRIKHLLDNRRIWFVPLLNPDGHEHTNDADRDWRPNLNLHRGRGLGVDINRNFDASWSDNWGSFGFVRNTWSGPSAESEPETKAIADLTRAHKFKASISYHSQSQAILPAEKGADEAFVGFVGKGMRELIRNALASFKDDPKIAGEGLKEKWAERQRESEKMLDNKLRNPRDDKEKRELIRYKQAVIGGFDNQIARLYRYGTASEVLPGESGEGVAGDLTEYVYQEAKGPHYTVELRPRTNLRKVDNLFRLTQPEKRLPENERNKVEEKKRKLGMKKVKEIYGSDLTTLDAPYNLDEEKLFGFTLFPEEQIQPCFLENLPAALALINCAGHGCSPEEQSLAVEKTGEPDHPAKVQVVRHCWRVFENWLQNSQA